MSRESVLKKSLRANRKRLTKLKAAVHRARVKIALREKQLKRIERDHGTGARKACEWAKAQVGTRERPPGSNRGPKIDAWAREVGGWMIAQPWCGSFYRASIKRGGKELAKDTVSTVAILNHGKRGDGGYARGLGAWRTAKPGGAVLYRFGSGAPVHHVGIYIGKGLTVEGNTSPGSSGSQNNGQGVWLRNRRGANVVAVAYPKWEAR